MSQRKGSVKEGDKCGICDKGVGDKDLGIQCELCEQWWHAGCVKIPEDVYKVLGKMSNLHWFCEACNSSARKVITSLTKLSDRMCKMETDLKVNKGECVKLNDRLEKIECLMQHQKKDMDSELSKVRETVEEIDKSVRGMVGTTVGEVEKKVESFKDIMEQQLKDELGDSLRREFMTPMNDEFEDVSKKIEESQKRLDEIVLANTEQADIESRRNNIILYRVPESSQVLADERRKEDVSFCEQFLSALSQAGSGVDPEDIKKVFRLGKRNMETGSPRPLLIQLSTMHAKNLLMESLYKLKSLSAKYKDVIVGHDLTKKQREECKALVSEAKEKSASGDWIYKVRGLPGHWKLVQQRRH